MTNTTGHDPQIHPHAIQSQAGRGRLGDSARCGRCVGAGRDPWKEEKRGQFWCSHVHFAFAVIGIIIVITFFVIIVIIIIFFVIILTFVIIIIIFIIVTVCLCVCRLFITSSKYIVCFFALHLIMFLFLMIHFVSSTRGAYRLTVACSS